MTHEENHHLLRACATSRLPAHQSSSDIAKLRQDLGIDADIDDAAIVSALESAGAAAPNAALLSAAVTAAITASNNAAAGAGRSGQRTVDIMKNVQDFTVGMANSEVGMIAAQAAAGKQSGGASTIGGLINAASKAQKVINLAESEDKQPVAD